MWLGFVALFAIIYVLHQSCNVVPVRMAEKGQCWDGGSMAYRACPQR